MKEPGLHLDIDLLFARASVVATEPLPHLGLGELEKREGHAKAFSRGAAIGIHAPFYSEMQLRPSPDPRST